ncbi:DUF459 domain-containing protein [Orbaceae bacterium ESL0727]|nr:DUF459 domain-containing protein [Orbaceae bacterium ESL0727]
MTNSIKNFSYHRKNGRRRVHPLPRTLPNNARYKTRKVKSQLKQNKQINTAALSVKQMFYILLITAVGLICFYQKSIKIYWQQTYHSDIALSSSLSLLPADKGENQLSSDNEASQGNGSEDNYTSLEESPKLNVKDQTDKPAEKSGLKQDQLHSSLSKEIKRNSIDASVTAGVQADTNKNHDKKYEDKNREKQTKSQSATTTVAEQKPIEKNSADHDKKTTPNPHIEKGSETQPVLLSSTLATPSQSALAAKSVTTKSPESSTSKQRILPEPITLTAQNKVFFAGDSLMQGVAPYVKKILFKQYKIESIDLSKQSTGLSYPSAFNWPKTISEQLDEDPAIHLLIVFLGANDPWDFPVKELGNKYVKFKSELWEEQYRLRIKMILNSAKEHNVQVLWLSPPCMRKPKLNEGIIYLNDLYQSEIREAQQHFLTTNNLLGCTYDNFSNFITTDKEKIKVRIDDGVHFTPTGQKILANAIMEHITIKEVEGNNSD